MLLYENKKAKLMNFLKLGLNPFKKFVSTGEIEEESDFVKSRKNLLESLKETIERDENFIFPVIGDVGTGKTHLFWALKNKLYYHNTIYISLEKVSNKFFYNTYSEFVEAIGVEPLRNIVNQLCNEWGALERKFGFFHVIDIQKVRKTAFEKLSTKFELSESSALIDIINGITTHQLDPYKKIEAEGWLLGELMNVRELSRLSLMHDLRNSKTAFTMLKLMIENSKLGTVIFIDDFEKVITMIKPIGDEKELEDIEEVFDPKWLYGNKLRPETIVSEKLIHKILKLNQIKGLRIIITLNSLSSLEEIRTIIHDIDTESTIKFIEPKFLKQFDENDTLEFYQNNMRIFLENIKFVELFEKDSDKFYPLNERILKNIHNKAKGNPREIIKILINIFNQIMFSDEELNKIILSYEDGY